MHAQRQRAHPVVVRLKLDGAPCALLPLGPVLFGHGHEIAQPAWHGHQEARHNERAVPNRARRVLSHLWPRAQR
eukprot:364791-Chlamydomonas_euryale.AAC.8